MDGSTSVVGGVAEFAEVLKDLNPAKIKEIIEEG